MKIILPGFILTNDPRENNLRDVHLWNAIWYILHNHRNYLPLQATLWIGRVEILRMAGRAWFRRKTETNLCNVYGRIRR